MNIGADSMNISIRHSRQSHRGWFTRLLLVITLALVVGVPRWSAAQAPADGPTQAVVTVKGMQCPFCAYGIRKHLTKLPGANKVEVELAKSQAIVTFAADATVTDEQIQEAVRKAGFTAGTIEWRSPGEGDQAGKVEAKLKTSETPGRA